MRLRLCEWRLFAVTGGAKHHRLALVDMVCDDVRLGRR